MTTQFEKDMQSPNKDLFLKVRALLLAMDGVEETQKPRITTFSNNKGGICHLRTMPHGIDIGFLKGARPRERRGLHACKDGCRNLGQAGRDCSGL